MLKKTIVIASLCMLPSVASAQQVGGYIEGNIGAAFLSSIDISVDSGETGSLDIGSDVIFGAEAGIRGFGNAENLRFGASWDHFKAGIDAISVDGVGSLTCAELAVESDGEITCSDLEFKVNVVAANVYIDLNAGNMGIQPFIGVGAGLALIDGADSQFAMSGTVGARYPLGMSAYIGGRYRYQWISGPSDSEVELGSISVHGVSAIFGVNF